MIHKQRSNVHPIPGAEPPTLDALLRHARGHGLSPKGYYRGGKVDYKTYKALSEDPLVQVGFDYLGENSYVALIEGIGFGNFAKAARADWRSARGMVDDA